MELCNQYPNSNPSYSIRFICQALQINRSTIYYQPKPDDQGVQYLSGRYVAKLNELGVCISLASRGKAWENSYVERLIRTLKEEEVSLHEYEDLEDARRRISYFLDEVYMRKRPHSSLGYMTPVEFEQEYVSNSKLLR